jgi:hypothetical protein
MADKSSTDASGWPSSGSNFLLFLLFIKGVNFYIFIKGVNFIYLLKVFNFYI